MDSGGALGGESQVLCEPESKPPSPQQPLSYAPSWLPFQPGPTPVALSPHPRTCFIFLNNTYRYVKSHSHTHLHTHTHARLCISHCLSLPLEDKQPIGHSVSSPGSYPVITAPGSGGLQLAHNVCTAHLQNPKVSSRGGRPRCLSPGCSPHRPCSRVHPGPRRNPRGCVRPPPAHTHTPSPPEEDHHEDSSCAQRHSKCT